MWLFFFRRCIVLVFFISLWEMRDEVNYFRGFSSSEVVANKVEKFLFEVWDERK